MKTPREVLLARHRHAEPKLEAMRRKIVAALPHEEACEALPAANTKSFQEVLRKAWLELVWPSRRAWVGLAALWLVVLGMNVEMKATSPAVPRGYSATAPEIVRAFQEQKRLLAELLPATAPAPAQEPRPTPSPRSERVLAVRPC